MQIDKGVPMPSDTRQGWGPGRRKYDFTSIAHGDSIHVASKAEVKTIRQSYTGYATRRGLTGFRVQEQKVGADDPRGAGWRVFFVSTLEAPSEDI